MRATHATASPFPDPTVLATLARQKFDQKRNRSLELGNAFAESADMGNLLWLIIIILIILWLGGFAFHIGGGLIHLLIVIALILLIVRLASGRRL
jgi:hypothetical protein